MLRRDSLVAAAPGQLQDSLASLEKDGCLAQGMASVLTASVVDALPFSLSQRRQLLGDSLATSGSVDLTSVNSLRVVSAVFRAGVSGASAISSGETRTSGDATGGLTLELRANPDLIGYEVAWYDIRAREDHNGFRIVPRSAELHIEGKVEPEPAPKVNQFVFEASARWFRFMVKTRVSRNDYGIVVLSASTASDLEARTAAFSRDATAFLASAKKDSYVAVPREIEVNPNVRVKVNGTATDIPNGDSVRQVIERSAGRGSAALAIPHLTILKPYAGTLRRVEWDHKTEDILALTLEGGEEIRW